jgi:hypothetical protein
MPPSRQGSARSQAKAPSSLAHSFCNFDRLSGRLIDVSEKRLGYRHTLKMQWGGEVVAFKSFTCFDIYRKMSVDV